jgi:hypothetical protein
MVEDRDERIWKARLRWRLRGAWQGPTFVASTLAGAVLLNRLPVAGDRGLDLIGGILLCGFLNLAIAGFLAPVLARLLRRRRPSAVPLGVHQDRVGTSLMSGLVLLLLVLGIGHRAAVQDSEREYREQLVAVRRYVVRQAPSEFRAGIGAEDVWKQGDGVFRTCVPGPDPRRSLCLYVDTEGVPTVTRDPDMQPNARLAGPDNPGRRGG